jgi:hypothetical protein
LKKITGSVRFRFYKHETEKTELNPNRKKPGKKPSQTDMNWFLSKKPEHNQNRSVWTGFGLKKNNFGLVTFLKKKTEPNWKWSPLLVLQVYWVNSIDSLRFIIYFDLLYVRLSESHDLNCGFSRVTQVDPCHFIYLFSMNLSLSH